MPTTPSPNPSVGVSTVTGLLAAVGAVILAVIAFINGDQSEEAIGALVSAAVVLYGVIRGRSDQATALIQRADPVYVDPALEGRDLHS